MFKQEQITALVTERNRLREALALCDTVAMLEVYRNGHRSAGGIIATTEGQARATIREARAALAKAEGRS